MAYSIETRENGNNELIQTHYYKTSYDNIKKALVDYLTKNQYSVSEFNDDYGEAIATKGYLSVTIKIIMQNPRETSVDFFVEYYGFLGRKKKVNSFLMDMYNYLGKQFEFKGLGLHQ